MPLNRRIFLQRLATAALAATQAGLGSTSISAFGSDTEDYRSLVCLFFFGGLDCHDLLLPYDAASYSAFAQRRRELLQAYQGTREREALLPLSQAASGGTASHWALPPELPGCKSLYDSRELALVANVGPLLEPTDAQSFADQSVALPARLFSHNDQQATWQAGAPEGAQYGWGGLFADAMVGEQADTLAFATIATAEAGPFLTGLRAFPYQLSTDGAARVNILDLLAPRDPEQEARMRQHLAGANYDGDRLIRRDLSNSFADALDTNDRFNAARGFAEPLVTSFPDSPLGQQLQAVAETIALRDVLGVQRQVFFVGIGGFDTHSDQATTLPGLLSSIDGGLLAFNSAMRELGVNDRVTLFSASDFGRTLAGNGDGSDHGWGGHHLVMGGAVAGGQLLGTPPSVLPEHDQDAGSGRLIPTLSVEQFAEPMGQWFGLTEESLLQALPRLSRFDRGTLRLFT